jgi:hypothetical protein
MITVVDTSQGNSGRVMILMQFHYIHASAISYAFAMFNLDIPALRYPLPLVLSRGLLTRLELVQVPSTHGQAALVVVHAFAKLVDVVRTSSRLLHLRGVLVLRCEVGVLGGSGRRLRR